MFSIPFFSPINLDGEFAKILHVDFESIFFFLKIML